jgi:hypothetical protein
LTEKKTPRSIDIHGLALRVTAFLIPADDLSSDLPGGVVERMIEQTREGSLGSLMLGIQFHCDTAEGERTFGLVLGPYVDPFELAGDISGCAETIAKRFVIDEGLDSIQAEQIARKIRRRATSRARRETINHTSPSVTCDFCNHSVAVIVGTQRYCKRHAEERGVRPHGKIGDE